MFGVGEVLAVLTDVPEEGDELMAGAVLVTTKFVGWEVAVIVSDVLREVIDLLGMVLEIEVTLAELVSLGMEGVDLGDISALGEDVGRGETDELCGNMWNRGLVLSIFLLESLA